MNARPSRRTFIRRLAVAATFASWERVLAREEVPTTRRPRRIGFLAGDFPDLNRAFLGELAARGFADGKNLLVEQRIQRLPNEGLAMATELAAMPLELIVVGALPFALMVRKANPGMPMVITTCPGMISNGFARSLERPGGLYTGIDELPAGVTAKRLDLLKMMIPAAKNIALLSTTPGVGGHEIQLEEAEGAARRLGVDVKAYRAINEAQLTDALNSIVADNPDAMLNFQGGLSILRRQSIVDFAAEHRLPAIYQATMFAEIGGLMAWAPDLARQFREAGRLTAKVLRGAKPGDLPIRHPANYSLSLNAETAKRMGWVFPPELLALTQRTGVSR